MWIRALAEADPSCGGKAAHLARLIAAGLPVPDGFVLEPAAFTAAIGPLPSGDLDDLGHALATAAAALEASELPSALVAEVRARAAALGTLAVRSSATIEDAEVGAAAGVFSSRIAVDPADVWPAIRAVWASALTPWAASYARRRAGELRVAVIIQRAVRGERRTIYTRPPGAPTGDEVWVQSAGEVPRVDRHPRSAAAPAEVALALRAEAAIAASAGADVELVGAHVVQARPIVHPAPVVRSAPPPPVLAGLVADGRTWTWDVAHNPDPLSPAQASLVEAVERAGIAPWSMRVCAGYLYTAPREPAPPPPAPRPLAEVAAELDALLADDLAAEPATIDAAIATYLAFYAPWSQHVVPAVRALRADLTAARLHGARPAAIERTLAAAARGEIPVEAAVAELGIWAPAWDIAVETYAERPAVLRAAIARAHDIPPSPPAAHPGAELAERDDLWFARAQWQVRRAVLARAAAVGIAAADAPWLPLAELAAEPPPPPLTAHRRATAARAAAARAARWDMPVVVGGPPPTPGPSLHGHGSGPRITGRVVRFASLGHAIPAVTRGDIVVTRAVTPALAVLVTGCGALISETGGPLDHGAAIARELGIPCIVGCRDAWSRLADGMIVTVDGDAGRVTLAG